MDRALESVEPRRWRAPAGRDRAGRFVFVVVHAARSQVDALADAGAEWRLTVVRTEAVVPAPEDDEMQEELARRDQATAREENLTQVRNRLR